MCKISAVSLDFHDGKPEDQVVVSMGNYGHGLAGFHKPDVSLEECAMCYQTGAVMEFSNIPPDVQKTYGIDETEIVTFHETPGSEIHYIQDVVEINSLPGLAIPLDQFADCGVSVRVVSIPACELDLAIAA